MKLGGVRLQTFRLQTTDLLIADPIATGEDGRKEAQGDVTRVRVSSLHKGESVCPGEG